ncbi:MAG: GAF domain-containing protein [bacterium]
MGLFKKSDGKAGSGADNLQDRINDLTSLLDVSKNMSSTLDINKLLTLIMEQVTKVIDVEAGSIALVDEITGELVFDVALGEKGKELKQVRMRPGEGIAGWVIAEGKPAVVNDVAKDKRFFARADQVTKFKTSSVMAVPLRAKDKIIGVMEAVNKKGSAPFDEKDQELMEAFSAHAAAAVENARMYSRCERRGKDLMGLNQQMKEAQGKLLQWERFSAIGEMAGSIAEQLVKPMKNISEGLNSIKEQMTNASMDTSIIDVLGSDNEKITKLMNNLMSFSSKQEVGEAEKADIIDSIKQSMAMVGQTTEAKGINIEVEEMRNTPPVLGNFAQLTQALVGVFKKSISALNSGDKITVYVSSLRGMRVPDAPQLTNFVEIRIVDSGRGMSSDKLLKIFDPNFKIEGEESSNIAMSRKIIEDNKGVINVDSTEGEGTTFTIRLPIAE